PMAQPKKSHPKRNATPKKSATPKPKLIPHTRKPDNLTEREWQTALRRQIAERDYFAIENTGAERVYSDYSVYNPTSGNTYKVALRSKDNSLNFCSCLDFKTNLLGSCKHIEAVRLKLAKQRGIKRLMDVVPEIPYSSLYVSYAGERTVRLRIGTANTRAFEKWKGKYFDSENTLLPAAYYDIDKLLREAYAINPSFRCYDDALDLIISQRGRNERHRLVRDRGAALLEGLSKVPLFP